MSINYIVLSGDFLIVYTIRVFDEKIEFYLCYLNKNSSVIESAKKVLIQPYIFYLLIYYSKQRSLHFLCDLQLTMLDD